MIASTNRAAWLAALAALCAAPLLAANVVHLKGGKTVSIRTIRWNAATREYVVQPAGGGDVSMNIPLKDVDHIEIDQPAEIEQARELLRSNRGAEAIPLLERVVASYCMLVWDNTAREWLARLYVDKQPAKAVAMVEEIVAAGGGRVISAPLRLKYWEALQSSGQQEKVAKDMDDAIATGPRDLVPQAQVMRGNLRRAAGKKDAALEDYLRTILFFESAGPARAEALFKAAELLDELADPQRAAALRQMLIQQYPDSDLARKAGGKV